MIATRPLPPWEMAPAAVAVLVVTVGMPVHRCGDTKPLHPRVRRPVALTPWRACLLAWRRGRGCWTLHERPVLSTLQVCALCCCRNYVRCDVHVSQLNRVRLDHPACHTCPQRPAGLVAPQPPATAPGRRRGSRTGTPRQQRHLHERGSREQAVVVVAAAALAVVAATPQEQGRHLTRTHTDSHRWATRTRSTNPSASLVPFVGLLQ